jgi:hypothetical protein
VTYYLNNITAVKEDERLKKLGIPKIHLEFESNSQEFLRFNEANLVLEEVQLIEIREKTNRTKVEPRRKN